MRSARSSVTVLLVVLCTPLFSAAKGSAEQDLPPALEDVGFDQRLGSSVPLDQTFFDEQGDSVAFGSLFGERPVILALVYYSCPMLCTMVLNGVTTSLKALDFDPGVEYDVVVVSFDPSDTAADATRTRLVQLQRFDRPGTESGWHFLTGDRESIAELTASVGFRFTAIDDSDDFAHAAGIVTLTPEGKVARYYYGVDYPPRDVRLGLVEAADNRIGSVVDQVLLYCFHYDPVTGAYSAVAMNIVRLGGGVTVVTLAIFVFLQWQREKRRQARAVEA
ncbi:MAG: SCO family protein [Acidobacteriota bacterium]